MENKKGFRSSFPFFSFPDGRYSRFNLKKKRVNRRGDNVEEERNERSTHFESVEDGSRYDGGPRDGKTLMSRPAVPASFRVPPRTIIGCYL